MSNTKIMRHLLSAGIGSNEIEFTSASSFRYRYWAQLPSDAYSAISDLAEEEIYEDHDGDERGRPIIRRLYSYENTTKKV